MIGVKRVVSFDSYPETQPVRDTESKIEEAKHICQTISVALCDLGGEKRMKFERITVDPNVCTGKPCIRGLRFPVSRLLGLLASGETKETILKAFPYLQAEDIEEALRYAAYLAEEETVEFSR